MENIIYTTPEEQIQKLKSQNLIINDEKDEAIAKGYIPCKRCIKDK